MTNAKSFRAHSMPVAREGWVFIFLFGVFAAFFFYLSLPYLGWPFLFLTLFTVYFFRNPERVPPQGDGILVSPADGRVIVVSDVADNPYTLGPAKKVSIFMSVFNVHVNRVPVSGEVEKVEYHPGKFLIASVDKASLDNERNAVFINACGRKIAVVQIAGLVARRIVCYLRQGDGVKIGERLGLIRFGSRVDLYLPVETEVKVSVGERVSAATTIIGSFPLGRME